MNILEILKYGDITLLNAYQSIPEAYVEKEGACGWWSVKDIMSHMSMNELQLEQVLSHFVNETPLAFLSDWETYGSDLNDHEVKKRRAMSPAEVIAEYQAAHGRIMELAPQISPETFRQNGTIPWYGAEYCLDDIFVFMDYAHKREHAGHIDVFRDRLPTN